MPLDLRKLEQQLDEALAKETKESLSEWLLNEKRRELNEAFLGEGTIELVVESSSSTFCKGTTQMNYSESQEILNYRFSIAA